MKMLTLKYPHSIKSSKSPQGKDTIISVLIGFEFNDFLVISHTLSVPNLRYSEGMTSSDSELLIIYEVMYLPTRNPRLAYGF